MTILLLVQAREGAHFSCELKMEVTMATHLRRLAEIVLVVNAQGVTAPRTASVSAWRRVPGLAPRKTVVYGRGLALGNFWETGRYVQ